jgi:hypothetical protein
VPARGDRRAAPPTPPPRTPSLAAQPPPRTAAARAAPVVLLASREALVSAGLAGADGCSRAGAAVVAVAAAVAPAAATGPLLGAGTTAARCAPLAGALVPPLLGATTRFDLRACGGRGAGRGGSAGGGEGGDEGRSRRVVRKCAGNTCSRRDARGPRTTKMTAWLRCSTRGSCAPESMRRGVREEKNGFLTSSSGSDSESEPVEAPANIPGLAIFALRSLRARGERLSIPALATCVAAEGGTGVRAPHNRSLTGEGGGGREW